MTATRKKWDGHTAAELRERWERESVFVFGAVNSTNDEARKLAEADAPSGTVVVAHEQTAGRGRGGRSWSSPPGAGLYLSMVFRPEALGEAPVTVLAGLGVVRRLDGAFPGLHPRIKWPNDLYADGLKFGGMLAEAAWSGPRPKYLVIGAGLNVRPLGEGISQRIARRATSIDEVLERTVHLADVADAVIAGLSSHVGAGNPRLAGRDLADLDVYDGMRDRRGVLAPPGGEDLPGTCVGIAPDGALLFRPDRGALRRVTDGSLTPE